MKVVSFAREPAIRPLSLESPFDSPVLVRGMMNHPGSDVTADGQQFLMLEGGIRSGPDRINVILNWFEELKQRVPPGRR